MQVPETKMAASGVPFLPSLPKKRGAYPPRESENNMREQRYTLVFMLESAALKTTKFMMPAAWRIPECANIRTNGLWVTTVAPVSVQGTKLTTMASAKM